MPVTNAFTAVSDVCTPTQPLYELTLFVSGASPLSARAVTDARGLCDVLLADRARLEVVDIHGDAHAAAEQGVLVTPSLVRSRPLPVRRIVGDLSDERKVLTALDIAVDEDADTATMPIGRGTTADKAAG